MSLCECGRTRDYRAMRCRSCAYPRGPIRLTQEDCEIPLNRGLVAFVDLADWPLIADYKWTAVIRRHTAYAFSHGDQEVYMHRLILQPPAGLWTDHIDGDGLNNRRSNLRAATPSQNMANRRPNARGHSSKFKGVSRVIQGHRPWQACIG